MERVTGIGGLFVRADDPAALSSWYHEHLGVRPVGERYEDGSWWQEAGPTVFAPFDRSTDELGPPASSWMLNLRVRDLDAMVEQLRLASIEVVVDPEVYPNGRFASTTDPEGNRVQLWEPAGTDLTPPPPVSDGEGCAG